MRPAEVIRSVKTSRLRGRGGAGFPCGLKWEFTRGAEGERKFVLCNADEGEPGTFKDRVLLTERPDRVFAGMTIAGYAIGAEQGILYLRVEYAYLRPFLEDVLLKRRTDGLLGHSVCGKGGFNFDIRIQMGAGAYICGEETSLISSCEGMRGDPKTRPPFPAQKGYLGCPTVVNNVETLCCVTKILEEGPATFSAFGTEQSSGTKLLSISGDCRRPGVYELPFGVTLRQVLKLAGADDAIAVQISGPSGQSVMPSGPAARHVSTMKSTAWPSASAIPGGGRSQPSSPVLPCTDSAVTSGRSSGPGQPAKTGMSVRPASSTSRRALAAVSSSGTLPATQAIP